MRKSPDKEFEQSIFQIYLSSYKKFKYWFAVFYFLVIVFYLVLYNEAMSEAHKSKEMDAFLERRDFYDFILNPEEKITLENIQNNILKKLNRKNIENGNWLKGTQQSQAFQLKAQTMAADTINLYSDNNFKGSIDNFKNDYLYNDSLKVIDTIAHYDSLINLDTLLYGMLWEKRQPYRNDIKSKFRASINKNQDQEIKSVLPIDDISNYIYNKALLSDTGLTEMSVMEIRKKAQEITSKVKNYEKEDIINPQNFTVPLSLEMLENYLLFILVIIALFLQFHFINYKFYENLFNDNQQKLIRVPALTNIIDNLKLPGLSARLVLMLIQGLSYFFNLFAPIAAIYVIASRLLYILDTYTLFAIAAIIYAIGFLSLTIYIWREFNLTETIQSTFKKLHDVFGDS